MKRGLDKMEIILKILRAIDNTAFYIVVYIFLELVMGPIMWLITNAIVKHEDSKNPEKH